MFLTPDSCFLFFFFLFCRPLFKDASGTLDKSARFSALYRQDSNKLSNDDMLKLLADFRKSVMYLRVQSIINSPESSFSCPGTENIDNVFLQSLLWNTLVTLEYEMFTHIFECGHIPLVHVQSVCLFLIQSLVEDSEGLTEVYFPFLRPEKMAKLPVILGNLDVTIDSVAPDLTSKPSKLAPCSQRER